MTPTQPVQGTEGEKVSILQGDCIEEMAEMEDASVDAVVCDPPAGISFMGKSWDGDKGGRDRWVAWMTEVMAEALRVCKPGAHALVWALPRTSHWTATALEDAGWEVRDRIAHHFGSGFPKSKNLGGGVGTGLKPATEDWWLCRKPFSGSATACHLEHGTGGLNVDGCRVEGAVPASKVGSGRPSANFDDDSYEWPGESSEPHSAGRFPANVVLSHAEDCVSVGSKKVKKAGTRAGAASDNAGEHGTGNGATYLSQKPSGSHYGDPDGTETVEAWECAPGCPVVELDAQSGHLQSGTIEAHHDRSRPGGNGNSLGAMRGVSGTSHGDSGGASRFFYCAKTSRAERNAGLELDAKPGGFKNASGRGISQRGDEYKEMAAANHHPTVKPINLMRWLVRLVTPAGGTILDPFLGSGTTGAAAVLEGFDFIGIEREPEYIAIAEARIAFWAQHEGRETKDVLKATKRRKPSDPTQQQLVAA